MRNWWSVGIQLLYRTERLWFFFTVHLTANFSWTSQLKQAINQFSPRKKRKFGPETEVPLTFCPFSCWNARRKQVQGGHYFKKEMRSSFCKRTKRRLCPSSEAEDVLLVPARGASSLKHPWFFSVLAQASLINLTSVGGTSV